MDLNSILNLPRRPQPAQDSFRIVGRDVRGPTIGSGNGCIQVAMEVIEPRALRRAARVVERGQAAADELRRILQRAGVTEQRVMRLFQIAASLRMLACHVAIND